MVDKVSDLRVPPGTMLVARVSGTLSSIPLPETGHKMIAVMDAIGCRSPGFIRIGKANGSDLVMIIDDLGHVEKTKGVNAYATPLYHEICKPGTTHEILGDVAIVRDEDFA